MTNIDRFSKLRFAAVSILDSLKAYMDANRPKQKGCSYCDPVAETEIEDLERMIWLMDMRSKYPERITDNYLTMKKDFLIDVIDEMFEEIEHYKSLGDDRKVAFLASCGMEDI